MNHKSPGQEADVILADGTIAVLRPVQPTDRALFVDFYARVSEESKYLRFFSPHPVLTGDDLNDWVDVDGRDCVTLVITRRGEIMATARYALVPELAPDRVADVSFLVRDDMQGKGAANILLEHLAQFGRESGFTRFFAEMIPSNQSMRQVFLRAGYDVRPALEDGVITVDFAIDPTERSRTVMHQREHRAEAASIRGLLNPQSLAVIGDAERMAPLLAAIRAGGFPGRLRTELREPVDLVIGAHGPDLAELISEAARLGARGIVALADGDNPNLSTAAAAELVARARAHGIRACGPASLGLINTTLPLNATPAPAPTAGRVGLFTQTAGVATLTLSRALERGCGISSFVASGAFADVTANDLMQYWSDDADTDICLLTLDAIGNPRKFFRVLRRLALEKSVVIFTPSRALRSARHHTAIGLSPVPPAALDEVIRHAGAIVTARRDTMFDIAEILSRQPVPEGRRVRVISNSSGLSEQLRQAAHRFGLHPSAVTVSGTTTGGLIDATRQALLDPHVDVVLTAAVEISCPIVAPVHRELEKLAATCSRPLIGVFVSFGSPPEGRDLPVFTSYADALEALALIIDNEERRTAARPDPSDELAPGPRGDTVDILRELFSAHPQGGWLSTVEIRRLLGAYGIDVVSLCEVRDVEEAVTAAAAADGTVVLKATHPMVRGRAELPAVLRGLDSADAVRSAWSGLHRLATELDLPGVLALRPVIQAECPAGTSVTLRAVEDPVLGPITSLGVSGPASQLLDDISWRVPPLRRKDARAMINNLRAAVLLTGYRGAPPVDLAALETLLMKLGRLKDELVSVVEIELGPVIAGPAGLHVVEARVRIAPLDPERDPLARTI